LDGVLVIDKPAGPTSHDVVARARRALRERRIGHTGTLDPMATGVLPLVIGRATRLASLLSSTDKTYEAGVRLGAATETYDAADRLAGGGAPPDAPAIDPAEIETALARFRGTFPQMPPPYSAKKVGGVPAYKLARKQQPTALTAVQVTVRELTLLGVDEGLVRLRVTGTAGFYVRSLAHDLGVALGCGAHLESLRRTRAGTFGLDRAILLDDLDRRPDEIPARLIPMTDLLPDLPVARLTARGAQRASHGNSVSPEDFHVTGTGPLVRLLDPGGNLLGIAEAGPDGLLRPSIVLV
jgi:tRNA pseudouridine55 synthase